MSHKWLIGVIAPLLCGCSSFSEVHYFQSADAKGKPVNYYRVSVNGGVFLANSRYISGYFDDKAVETYFNEFTQPDKGALNPSASDSTKAADGSTATTQPAETAQPPDTVQPMAPNLKDKRLVLLLSSNSDDIATGISSIAQNNDLAATLQKIVTRKQTDTTTKAANDAKVETARATVLGARTDAAMTGAAGNGAAAGNGPGAGDLDSVRSNLVPYAEELARFLGGNDVHFTSAKDAAEWLKKHKS